MIPNGSKEPARVSRPVLPSKEADPSVTLTALQAAMKIQYEPKIEIDQWVAAETRAALMPLIHQHGYNQLSRIWADAPADTTLQDIIWTIAYLKR